MGSQDAWHDFAISGEGRELLRTASKRKAHGERLSGLLLKSLTTQQKFLCLPCVRTQEPVTLLLNLRHVVRGAAYC